MRASELLLRGLSFWSERFDSFCLEIPVLRQAAHPEIAAFTSGRSRYRSFIDGTEITFQEQLMNMRRAITQAFRWHKNLNTTAINEWNYYRC
jgi:hypothetical protein